MNLCERVHVCATKELLMNTTETIVDTEVVFEGVQWVSSLILLDGSPSSTEDKYAAIVEGVLCTFNCI